MVWHAAYMCAILPSILHTYMIWHAYLPSIRTQYLHNTYTSGLGFISRALLGEVEETVEAPSDEAEETV
jgi:hypothetical protein